MGSLDEMVQLTFDDITLVQSLQTLIASLWIASYPGMGMNSAGHHW